MLAMVAGGRGFAANPLDGITFLFEPVRPLAATIIHYVEDLSNPADGHDAVRDGGRAARLLRAALARRLGRQAAAEALRDPHLSDGRSSASARARPRALEHSAPARLDLAPGRCSTASATWLCWAAGIGLCVVTAAIVLFMLVKGISYLRPSLFVQLPTGSLDQSQAGGFLDPIEGTLLVTAIGIAIAAPLGVALAAWLSEYRRPAGSRGRWSRASR